MTVTSNVVNLNIKCLLLWVHFLNPIKKSLKHIILVYMQIFIIFYYFFNLLYAIDTGGSIMIDRDKPFQAFFNINFSVVTERNFRRYSLYGTCGTFNSLVSNRQ